MLFTPEERYLAHLCRISPPLENEDLVICPATFAEEAFIKLVLENTLAPLLFWKMDHPSEWQRDEIERFQQKLSASSKDRLKSAFQRSWLSSLVRERFLKSLTTLFDSEGIHFTLYKGISTCREFYPDKATRPMADLDLLIAPKDLDLTVTLLKKEGLECWSETHGYERGFRDPSTQISLDLHFHVNWPYQSAIDSEHLIERGEVDKLSGYRMFPLVEQVILHILHQCKHAFLFPYVRLSSFVELREMVLLLLNRWDEVEALAKKWELETALWYGLWLLDKLYPALLQSPPSDPPMTLMMEVLRLPPSNKQRGFQSIIQWQLRHFFATTIIDRPPKRLAYLYERVTHWLKIRRRIGSFDT